VVYEAVFEVFEMLPLAALVGSQVRVRKAPGPLMFPASI
jgi:hypothetical protein